MKVLSAIDSILTGSGGLGRWISMDCDRAWRSSRMKRKTAAAGASTVFNVYTEAGRVMAHVLSEHTKTICITCRLVGPQFYTEFVHEDRSDLVVADALRRRYRCGNRFACWNRHSLLQVF